MSKTPIRAAESVPDGFDAIQRRFLSLTSRLEALKDTLGNSENMPIGLGAAAFVFRETTEEMVQLQEDIEDWHSAHEHTPKEVQ
jgi:hypothetical protein